MNPPKYFVSSLILTFIICAFPHLKGPFFVGGRIAPVSGINGGARHHEWTSSPAIDQTSPSFALTWPIHQPYDDRSAMSQGFAFYKFIDSKNPYHTGLDLVHDRAITPVFAAATGEIVKIQENDLTCPNPKIKGKRSGCEDHGMGNTVIVRHDLENMHLYTQYSHLDSISSNLISSCGSLDNGKRGRHTCSSSVTVTTNTELGKVGQTGQGDADYWKTPHLHFELKENPFIGAHPNSDDLGTEWGYTSSHPSGSGFKDPIPLVHAATDFSSAQLAQTISNAVLKYGPGGAGNHEYPTFNIKFKVGQKYEAVRSAPGITLTTCSSGLWYEIRPLGGGVFNVGGNKQVGSGWICSETVTGVTPPSNWILMFPAASPPARQGAGMAYDAARQQIVLFGGVINTPGGGMFVNDTWTWDGTDWTQRFPVTSPPLMKFHSMAYDAARQEVVLFGGGGNGFVFNETWIWDGTNWTQRFPANSPPPRDAAAMVYDSVRQEIVLFGGSIGPQGDTWTWNGLNWLQKSPPTSPQPRYFAAMAFDTLHGKAVLFGGIAENTVLSDTWLWDGATWTNASPIQSPQARYSPLISYDALHAEVVLFGGALSDNTVVAETWIWNGNSWNQRYPTTSPAPRVFGGITYDEARTRVTLFGGDSNAFTHIFLNDTWVWSPD